VSGIIYRIGAVAARYAHVRVDRLEASPDQALSDYAQRRHQSATRLDPKLAAFEDGGLT
jgi:hypothetical protein